MAAVIALDQCGFQAKAAPIPQANRTSTTKSIHVRQAPRRPDRAVGRSIGRESFTVLLRLQQLISEARRVWPAECGPPGPGGLQDTPSRRASAGRPMPARAERATLLVTVWPGLLCQKLLPIFQAEVPFESRHGFPAQKVGLRQDGSARVRPRSKAIAWRDGSGHVQGTGWPQEAIGWRWELEVRRDRMARNDVRPASCGAADSLYRLFAAQTRRCRIDRTYHGRQSACFARGSVRRDVACAGHWITAVRDGEASPASQ